MRPRTVGNRIRSQIASRTQPKCKTKCKVRHCKGAIGLRASFRYTVQISVDLTDHCEFVAHTMFGTTFHATRGLRFLTQNRRRSNRAHSSNSVATATGRSGAVTFKLLS